MAIIKITPEALFMRGVLPALQVKYGTLVLKDVESFTGDPSGMIMDLKVYHKDHPENYMLDLIVKSTTEGVEIIEAE